MPTAPAGIASAAELAAWDRTLVRRLVGRRSVVVAALAIVLTGMAYSLWWGVVVRHVHGWITPGDFWDTLRGASDIGWGGEGILYASHTALVTFPGICILLAPVAMLSGHLGLTDSFPPLAVPHPTEWLVAGPVELLLGAVLLFPLDVLAGRLGVAGKRRTALVWLEAALVWPSVAIWGHPEDPLALALGLYGLMAAWDGRWRRSAVMFALSTLFQPLTLLLLPLALTLLPWRTWAPSIGIIVAPTAAVLVAPLVQAWHATTHALVDQPNYPTVDHPTPWLPLAPVLQRPHRLPPTDTLVHTAHGFVVHAIAQTSELIVAGGPERLIAVGASLVVGAWALRRRPSEVTLLWLAALVLAGRCVFESVLDPYYFVPAIALALLVAATGRPWRLAAAVVAAGTCTWFSYQHVGPWAYYLPVTVLLLGAVAVGWPRASSEHRLEGPETEEEPDGARSPGDGGPSDPDLGARAEPRGALAG